MNDTFECPFCHETHEVTGEHIWFPCLGGFSLNWLRCKDYIQLHYQNQEQHCWTVLAYHIAHKFNLISYAGAHRQPIDFEKVLKENILPKGKNKTECVLIPNNMQNVNSYTFEIYGTGDITIYGMERIDRTHTR